MVRFQLTMVEFVTYWVLVVVFFLLQVVFLVYLFPFFFLCEFWPIMPSVPYILKFYHQNVPNILVGFTAFGALGVMLGELGMYVEPERLLGVVSAPC